MNSMSEQRLKRQRQRSSASLSFEFRSILTSFRKQCSRWKLFIESFIIFRLVDHNWYIHLLDGLWYQSIFLWICITSDHFHLNCWIEIRRRHEQEFRSFFLGALKLFSMFCQNGVSLFHKFFVLQFFYKFVVLSWNSQS